MLQDPIWRAFIAANTCNTETGEQVVQIADSADTITPGTFKQVIQSVDALRWQTAMNEEFDSIIKNETWTFVTRSTMNNKKA